jgi:hypothetical protein
VVVPTTELTKQVLGTSTSTIVAERLSKKSRREIELAAALAIKQFP